MTDAKQYLDAAYGLLAQIHVNGEDVDKMYFVRQQLKAAYAALDKSEEKEEEHGGN